MKTKLWRNASFVSAIIAGSIVLWAAAPALADSPKVVQIEEQWELSLANRIRASVRRRPRW